MAQHASEQSPLTYDDLRAAVEGRAAGVRLTVTLEPAGGPGDKVFPPTYEGGRYATERRRVGDVEVETVLLDSVQSQANRMELALKAALERDELAFPLLAVDFSRHFPQIGRITTLDAPHRIADAIFRDSLLKGKLFRESPQGQAFTQANIRNATPLFELCPTALIFGVWDSTGPLGGGGNKFARALVSEIVGFRSVTGKRTASRIDPLHIQAEAGLVYVHPTEGWTLDVEQASRDARDNPILVGGREGRGRPSAINHGNVLPTIVTDDDGEPVAGGVTISHAQQTAVLSFPALRRLRFPVGTSGPTHERDEAARAVLAALALVAVAYQNAEGYDLRSRCLLVLKNAPILELLPGDGGPSKPFGLTSTEALTIFERAVKVARDAGLPWSTSAVVLEPAPKLVELVRRSIELARAAPTGE